MTKTKFHVLGKGDMAGLAWRMDATGEREVRSWIDRTFRGNCVLCICKGEELKGYFDQGVVKFVTEVELDKRGEG